MPRRGGAASRRRTSLALFGSRRRMSQSISTEIAMLMSALQELAAIRSTAEQAAGHILTSAEDLMVSPSISGASRQAAEEKALAIITACGFHDLVGQRAANVAETLDKIINARLKCVDGARKKPKAERQRRKIALLLHGPALPAASPDQTQIDALFAEA
jgi:chemotaxis regulatin CheY-phosphate phosphatase CheZ